MSRTAPSADQPAPPTSQPLFERAGNYTVAERDADRRTCRAYLKQWAGGFKSTGDQPEISFDEFEAAATRLAL